MSFVSFQFWAVLLPIVYLLYLLLGRTAKIQNFILLAASIIFYGSYDLKYLIVLGASILVTYLGGLIGAKQEDKTKGGRIYSAALVLNLLLLVVFKYTNFILGNLNSLLGAFGLSIALPSLLLPVGLSFYVFQSSTYLMDLKSGRCECEKDIISYALFVSFFPSVVSGPILRASNMLPQINKRREATFERFQIFIFSFLWGMFLKLVLSDRLVGFVGYVYQRYYDYGGFTLFVHTCISMLQLYIDFAGYSFMAIAVAALFGFDVPDNFRQPWLSTTVAEFWRRWHISMMSWFTDYLYIPLGGSRKGKARQYLNTLIVFAVSGLWHGAAWTFMLWGLAGAAYMIIGKLLLPARIKVCEKLGVSRETFGFKTLQRFLTFFLIAPLVDIFSVGTLRECAVYFKRMLTVWNPWVLFDGSLFDLGMSAAEWRIAAAAGLVMLTASVLREKGYGCRFIIKQNPAFRVALFLTLVFAIVIFGVYGSAYSASAFVYAGF